MMLCVLNIYCLADPAIIPRTVRRAAGWRAYASGCMPGVLGGVYTRGYAAKARGRISDLPLIPAKIASSILARAVANTSINIVRIRALLNAVDALLQKQSIARRESWRVVPTKELCPGLCAVTAVSKA